MNDEQWCYYSDMPSPIWYKIEQTKLNNQDLSDEECLLESDTLTIVQMSNSNNKTYNTEYNNDTLKLNDHH